jgi:hypothetical protein
MVTEATVDEATEATYTRKMDVAAAIARMGGNKPVRAARIKAYKQARAPSHGGAVTLSSVLDLVGIKTG